MQLKTKIAAGAGLVGLAVAAIVTVMAATRFTPTAKPIGYVGQPVPSSYDVSSGTARMFAIDYDAATLGGNLHSYVITAGGAIGTEDKWSGGANGVIAKQTERFIVTTKEGGTGGISFTWPTLSTGQRALLDPGTPAANSFSPLLNYLRGAKDGEGTTSRFRTNVLGTIVHSTPVYWKDATGNETVYVGANDGMMHAINAVDGSERFAYVPAVLLPTLNKLKEKTYTGEYYVDGRFDIRKMGTQTVLVGALGGGGKGIYALDITVGKVTSEADAAAKVMWEITNASSGYANLGDTYGAPVLTKLRKKGAAAGAADEFYDALVIGNGYNNTGSGAASLFVINAKTGALIKEIVTASGGTNAAPGGLSSASLWDTDEDGIKDVAYAGDIDGNMWKFDLFDLNATPVKLHTREGSLQDLAITTAPGLVRHPSGGVLVAFVTGRIFTPADATSTAVHYAYAIRDGAAASLPLLTQTIIPGEFVNGTTKIRVRGMTENKMDWTAYRGWKVALDAGERVVGDGVSINGDVFQFFSTNPTIDPTAKPPGENWWMQLNWRTGGSTNEVIFDLNDDSRFTAQDMVTVGSKTLYPVGRHMGGGVRSQLIGLAAKGIDVFQSNFDKNDAPKVNTVDITTEVANGTRGVAGGHFDTDIFCYQRCGGSTKPSEYTTGPAAASGNYTYGQADSDDEAAGQNYVHVHEYDDIYDVLGLNMLHPSQDEQRLALVKATTKDTYSPDLPTLMANNSPSPAGTVIDSDTVFNTSSRQYPDSYSTYSEGIRTNAPDYPKMTRATDGSLAFETRISYPTYRTSYTFQNIKLCGNGRDYCFAQRTVKSHWTTTQTTVDTIPNTRFRVLVANQAYSPAVKLKIDGSDGTGKNGDFNGGVIGFQTTAGLKIADIAAYKLNDITDMQFSMPLEAFVVKDWGTGVVRAGVHPISPLCAGVSDGDQNYGPNGEWRNGALTLQVISDTATDADIELNDTTNNDPRLGYRLKQTSLKSKLIAEYLIYWHHPTSLCMGSPNWTAAAAPDNGASTAKQGVSAVGARDPKGSFQQGDGTDKPAIKPETNPPDVVKTNPDGSVTTTSVKYTSLNSGGYTIETTVKVTWPGSPTGTNTGIETGGAVGSSAGGVKSECNPLLTKCGVVDKSGIEQKAAALGRISWRELQR